MSDTFTVVRLVTLNEYHNVLHCAIRPTPSQARCRSHSRRDTAGPFWLRDPRVASMLEQALRYGETTRKLYLLHAWVSMPNHVHVILEPGLALPPIMRWLKGRTGRKANQILARKGQPFWQDESYDTGCARRKS